MIKLEHVVLPSPEQMEFVIEGMRNPMNSWDKSDSELPPMVEYDGRFVSKEYFLAGKSDSRRCVDTFEDCIKYETCDDCPHNDKIFGNFALGANDLTLMKKLSAAGTDHRKFMRMMPVMVRITAPLYWWKEFDTYKIGTVANSCSTMHKITEKEFTHEDFSTEHLMDWEEDWTCKLLINERHSPDGYPWGISPVGGLHTIIDLLNKAREYYLEMKRKLKEDVLTDNEREEITELKKQYWWQLIQLLPSSYNQTRNVMLNYEVLANIYPSRKNHKLDEWQEFCKWIETLPYHELITGEEKIEPNWHTFLRVT